MGPDKKLAREFVNHVLSTETRTVIKVENKSACIDEIAKLKNLLSQTQFSSGREYFNHHEDEINEILSKKLSSKCPSVMRYRIQQMRHKEVIMRFDKYAERNSMPERSKMVDFFFNLDVIRSEVKEAFSEKEFELISCIGASKKFNLTNLFITRPGGGPDGGIDYGGTYDFSGTIVGLVGEAKMHSKKLGKGLTNGQIMAFNELHNYLLENGNKPQSLPDLPESFTSCGYWSYFLSSIYGFEGSSETRMREHRHMYCDINELLMWVFEKILGESADVYDSFFSGDDDVREYNAGQLKTWLTNTDHGIESCG
ncbi:hypothetical protein N9L38_04435 [Candidatus Poseidoniales archaeon]|nr:hypothetical protein [Candidatus Poseidoniales archaeon]